MLAKLLCKRVASTSVCKTRASRVAKRAGERASQLARTPDFQPSVLLAGIRAPHANAESARGLGLSTLHALITVSNAQQRQPAASRLPLHTLIARRPPSVSARNAAAIERVPLNHAALAPCCKTHGYRGRAGVAAVEHCLGRRPRRELVALAVSRIAVAVSSMITTVVLYTRPTQAIHASLIP